MRATPSKLFPKLTWEYVQKTCKWHVWENKSSTNVQIVAWNNLYELLPRIQSMRYEQLQVNPPVAAQTSTLRCKAHRVLTLGNLEVSPLSPQRDLSSLWIGESQSWGGSQRVTQGVKCTSRTQPWNNDSKYVQEVLCTYSFSETSLKVKLGQGKSKQVSRVLGLTLKQ